jgi:apolipoprotein N-acyltransferase
MPFARAAATLASAGLYALAFPPWNLHALAWVALVPLLVALRGVSLARAALLGGLWGVAMIWCVGIWLPPALAHYYQQPLWFGLLFSAGASVVFIGVYHAAFAACAAAILPRLGGVAGVVSVAALWVAWEFAKARVLTGDPWLLLGYALAGEPAMMQTADLGGVYLLSFLLVLANTALAGLVRPGIAFRTRTVALALPLGLVFAAWAYGGWRLAAELPAQPRVPVVIVQGNNDMGAEWRDEIYGASLETYLRLSYDAAPKGERSLIVWPESAVTFFVADEPLYRRQIGRMLTAANAELVLGGPHREGEGDAMRFFNSAFVIDSRGEVVDRYDKGHLMPFAEYFPLRTVEFLRRRFERVRYFTAGEAGKLLRSSFGDLAPAICFEGMFPELVGAQMRRGAVALLSLSNDAWLGRGAGPEQHLWMMTVRAVENRTWVVRATTTGVSAIIDPWGRLVARSERDVAAVLRGDIVPLRIETFYERHGDIFAWLCVVASLMALKASVLIAASAGRADQA